MVRSPGSSESTPTVSVRVGVRPSRFVSRGALAACASRCRPPRAAGRAYRRAARLLFSLFSLSEFSLLCFS